MDDCVILKHSNLFPSDTWRTLYIRSQSNTYFQYLLNSDVSFADIQTKQPHLNVVKIKLLSKCWNLSNSKPFSDYKASLLIIDIVTLLILSLFEEHERVRENRPCQDYKLVRNSSCVFFFELVDKFCMGILTRRLWIYYTVCWILK